MTRPINFIVVHHTGRASATVETIRHTHMVTLHQWDDIGYHSVIQAGGVTRPGRPEHRVGAHAANLPRDSNMGREIAALITRAGGSANIGSLGVTVAGDFRRAIPSHDMIQALCIRLESWCRTYMINPKHIIGHCDLQTRKSCPGPYLYRMLPKIREQVAGKLSLTI